MSCIEKLLVYASAPRLRDYLEGQLRGSNREFVLKFLPQKWVFVTETETASIGIDESGRVLIPAESSLDPDVVVTWNDRSLEPILLEPSNRLWLQPGEVPLVCALTERGRIAFDRLARRFGLDPEVDRPYEGSEENEDDFF